MTRAELLRARHRDRKSPRRLRSRCRRSIFLEMAMRVFGALHLRLKNRHRGSYCEHKHARLPNTLQGIHPLPKRLEGSSDLPCTLYHIKQPRLGFQCSLLVSSKANVVHVTQSAQGILRCLVSDMKPDRDSGANCGVKSSVMLASPRGFVINSGV